MNEFFLISITFLAYFIKGNDKAPALLYCLIAHVFYQAAFFIPDTILKFKIGMVSDVTLVLLLACLAGCLRSALTFFLIPMSIISIATHFTGWAMFMADPERSFAAFNSFVVFHMCVIIALFLFAAGGYGNINWNTRLLPRDDNNPKSVGVVSK